MLAGVRPHPRAFALASAWRVVETRDLTWRCRRFSSLTLVSSVAAHSGVPQAHERETWRMQRLQQGPPPATIPPACRGGSHGRSRSCLWQRGVCLLGAGAGCGHCRWSHQGPRPADQDTEAAGTLWAPQSLAGGTHLSLRVGGSPEGSDCLPWSGGTALGSLTPASWGPHPPCRAMSFGGGADVPTLTPHSYKGHSLLNPLSQGTGNL